MGMLIKTLAAVAAGIVLAASALALGPGEARAVTFTVPATAKWVRRAGPRLARPRPRQIGDAQHPTCAVIAFAPAPRPFKGPVVGYARVSTVIPIEIRAAPMAANLRRRP